MEEQPAPASAGDKLHIHKGPAAPAKLNFESVTSATGRSLKVVEVDFAELADGGLAETIEHPDNAGETLLAVYKDGIVRYEKMVRDNDRVLVPLSRDTEILRHVRFPRGVKPYDSLTQLLGHIISVLKACLDIERPEQLLMGCFALSTHFVEKLPIAPYLALVGLPGSGKTTALRVLSRLCRRSILTADITPAAFLRAYQKLTPTLIVDETSTAGEQRKMFHLLRAGSTPDLLAFRSRDSFKAFGAKVFSWTTLPNDAALNTRCIIIPMHETSRTDLLKPTDPRVIAATDTIHQQLLQFRFEHYNSLDRSNIVGGEGLHSRIRDLYEALALPIGDDAPLTRDLARFFALQQELNREPLPSNSAAVVRNLFQLIHSNPAKGKCVNRDVTQVVNLDFEHKQDPYRMTDHETGAILTSLGFARRKRTNKGYLLLLDLRTRMQIHELARTHEIEGFVDGCDTCKELASRARATGNHSGPEKKKGRGRGRRRA